MSFHTEENICWYDSLDDAKSEQYIPIKCWSVLQFFELKPKASSLIKANLVPIKYLYYALFSPQENRYYKKLNRPYDLDMLYFYKKSDTFSGQDEAVENLRNYVADGNVTLLMTPPQVEATQKMLNKIHKSYFSKDGKMPYKDYIQIMDMSLKYEDYKDVAKNLTGFKTACSQFEKGLSELWGRVLINNK